MKATLFDRCFYKCPGAWTGYYPKDANDTGLITVNPANILEAAKHIKRFYRIVGIAAAPETTHPTLKTALFITIAHK